MFVNIIQKTPTEPKRDPVPGIVVMKGQNPGTGREEGLGLEKGDTTGRGPGIGSVIGQGPRKEVVIGQRREVMRDHGPEKGVVTGQSPESVTGHSRRRGKGWKRYRGKKGPDRQKSTILSGRGHLVPPQKMAMKGRRLMSPTLKVSETQSLIRSCTDLFFAAQLFNKPFPLL